MKQGFSWQLIPAGRQVWKVFCFFDEGKLVILLNCFQNHVGSNFKRTDYPAIPIPLEDKEKNREKYFRETNFGNS